MMGLVTASFADSIGGLVATQGVLYGGEFILNITIVFLLIH